MENKCYVRLYFECDADELFNTFVDKIQSFIREYDGRLEEFLSSSITAYKGKVYKDPWEDKNF